MFLTKKSIGHTRAFREDTLSIIYLQLVIRLVCMQTIHTCQPRLYAFIQGRVGHRLERHLLQDPVCADANAIAGLQPAGGQRQPRLLGPLGRGASFLHDLHLWTV